VSKFWSKSCATWRACFAFPSSVSSPPILHSVWGRENSCQVPSPLVSDRPLWVAVACCAGYATRQTFTFSLNPYSRPDLWVPWKVFSIWKPYQVTYRVTMENSYMDCTGPQPAGMPAGTIVVSVV
jgi:hypothetical protein